MALIKPTLLAAVTALNALPQSAAWKLRLYSNIAQRTYISSVHSSYQSRGGGISQWRYQYPPHGRTLPRNGAAVTSPLSLWSRRMSRIPVSQELAPELLSLLNIIPICVSHIPISTFSEQAAITLSRTWVFSDPVYVRRPPPESMLAYSRIGALLPQRQSATRHGALPEYVHHLRHLLPPPPHPLAGSRAPHRSPCIAGPPGCRQPGRARRSARQRCP